MTMKAIYCNLQLDRNAVALPLIVKLGRHARTELEIKAVHAARRILAIREAKMARDERLMLAYH